MTLVIYEKLKETSLLIEQAIISLTMYPPGKRVIVKPFQLRKFLNKKRSLFKLFIDNKCHFFFLLINSFCHQRSFNGGKGLP